AKASKKNTAANDSTTAEGNRARLLDAPANSLPGKSSTNAKLIFYWNARDPSATSQDYGRSSMLHLLDRVKEDA
ncbi:hypothetical protein, partial [Thalassobacterium maritimum]|uniref:hypothetical protein n=1 Tax=Thalassobacterium maritimum TaxID=3041265 RepID=UPI002810F780